MSRPPTRSHGRPLRPPPPPATPKSISSPRPTTTSSSAHSVPLLNLQEPSFQSMVTQFLPVLTTQLQRMSDGIQYLVANSNTLALPSSSSTPPTTTSQPYHDPTVRPPPLPTFHGPTQAKQPLPPPPLPPPEAPHLPSPRDHSHSTTPMATLLLPTATEDTVPPDHHDVITNLGTAHHPQANAPTNPPALHQYVWLHVHLRLPALHLKETYVHGATLINLLYLLLLLYQIMYLQVVKMQTANFAAKPRTIRADVVFQPNYLTLWHWMNPTWLMLNGLKKKSYIAPLIARDPTANFLNLTGTWFVTWAWSWLKVESYLDYTVNASQPAASGPVTPTPRSTGPYVSTLKVISAYFLNFVDHTLQLILRATATLGYMPPMMVLSPGFWRKGLFALWCGLSTRIHPCQHRISPPTDSLVWEPSEDGTMLQLGQRWETTATSGNSTISAGFWQEL